MGFHSLKILVVADVPGWAWGRKADAYQEHLGAQHTIHVAYQAQGRVPPFPDYDVVHLFEVSQLDRVPADPPGARPYKLVAGLTANVWRTWGEARMHRWAAQIDGLHANSLLLYHELRQFQFHPHVFYLPNGVNTSFFRRWHPQPARAVFGHVGKPNPRKGGDLIIEAARKAGVELRTVIRTSKLAMAPEKMAAWYQGISVMVTASNMDGTPNPMLEGAATECALLSTPIGNMPELIRDGYNGWLTVGTLPYHGPGPVCQQPEDYAQCDALRDELVARMRWFADHPAETLTMGKAARDSVVADWTWARQVQHVAAMWTQLCA